MQLFYKKIPTFLFVYNLQNYSRMYVHKSAKGTNLGYGKCFTSHFQKTVCHNWAFTLRYFIFNQNIWCQPSFYCPKL